MKAYEVTLTHKEKLIVPAETPNDAIAVAIEKSKNHQFAPTQFGAKEKADEE